MINFNPNVGSITPKIGTDLISTPKPGAAEGKQSDFADAIKAAGKYISKVDQMQQSSDTSIKDLLTGKNEDINSVVAEMAKADLTFKLLVGVRNKLIEAYKQTMNMPL
jgi:flagellar hook-basal body complex protein FliE